MTNYFVSVGEREYRVKIHGGKLTVDGEPLDVDLVALNGSGAQLLRRNRQALELHFSPQEALNYQVLVEGYLVQAKVRKQGCTPSAGYRQTAASQSDGGQEKQASSLYAPMPGLVVGIQVKIGDVVEKGQLLAVVESMKMQMQLRSPAGGKVTGVAVQPGQQVRKGQVLILVAESQQE